MSVQKHEELNRILQAGWRVGNLLSRYSEGFLNRFKIVQRISAELMI